MWGVPAPEAWDLGEVGEKLAMPMAEEVTACDNRVTVSFISRISCIIWVTSAECVGTGAGGGAGADAATEAAARTRVAGDCLA